MEGRNQLRAAVFELPPAQPRNRIRCLEQRLRREFAERNDHARLDHFDLAEQEGLALLHLIAFGVAVAGRPALDHVGDVDLVAGQADGLDDLGQQLAGAAHERLAALVFFFTGRLADEHQPRFRIADAEDDLRAAESAQLTTTTVLTDVRLNGFKAVYPAKAGHHRSLRRVFLQSVVSGFSRMDSSLPPLRIAADALDTDLGEIFKV